MLMEHQALLLVGSSDDLVDRGRVEEFMKDLRKAIEDYDAPHADRTAQALLDRFADLRTRAKDLKIDMKRASERIRQEAAEGQEGSSEG